MNDSSGECAIVEGDTRVVVCLHTKLDDSSIDGEIRIVVGVGDAVDGAIGYLDP